MSAFGFESVLFDLRAHGVSEGQFVTYGYYEKSDISQAISYVKSENDSATVGIRGNSLGGAIALQAMAVDDRIDYGVIENTFRELAEIITDYQHNIVDVPLGYYLKTAVARAEEMARFRVRDVSPVASAREVENLVLIAHGTDDQRLFDNLRSPDKRWVPVEGGRHYGLGDTGGEEYYRTVTDFILRHATE